MRNLAGLTLSIGIAALFAGCSGSQPPIGMSERDIASADWVTRRTGTRTCACRFRK